MKYLLSVLTLLCAFGLSAQQEDVSPQVKNASPYPAANSTASDSEARFIAAFDKDRNVGNLHVYSFLNTPAEDYYFAGEELDNGFSEMYPEDLRDDIRQSNAKVYAVQSVRGEGDEYYIIRTPGSAGNNRLAMYEVNNDKLTFKIDLADAKKSGSQIVQTDSWILDLNGDVLLDVVRIKSVRDAEGKIIKREEIAYLQQENGTFQEEEMQLDPYQYKPENLSKQ